MITNFLFLHNFNYYRYFIDKINLNNFIITVKDYGQYLKYINQFIFY